MTPTAADSWSNRGKALAWLWAGRLARLGMARDWSRRCFWRAALSHADTAVAFASLAHDRAVAGQGRAARGWQRRAVAAAPQVAAYHYNLGYLLEQAGRSEAAEAAFRQALQRAPSLDLAWYGLGLVLQRQGRLAEAQAALTENTRLQPLSPHGWVALATVCRERGLYDEADRLVSHLHGFEPRVARRLRQDWSGATSMAACPSPGGA